MYNQIGRLIPKEAYNPPVIANKLQVLLLPNHPILKEISLQIQGIKEQQLRHHKISNNQIHKINLDYQTQIL